MNPHLEFLLSTVYDAARCDVPAHLADLRKSGLTDETIRAQRFTDVPPSMIDQLLQFPTPGVTSAYLLPFADPRGGWMEHVRLKIFPPLATPKGTIKYLQPRNSGVRLYFPLETLEVVMRSDESLYLVEGEKKSLAVAQIGLPAVGIAGIEGWHVGGLRTLGADFDVVKLRRVVKIVPDADVRTNPAVARATYGLAAALERRGAHVQIVMLPAEVAA